MQTKKMEILPFLGLDDLKFGLSTDEVAVLIGGPDETEVIEADDDEVESLLWYYHEAGLTLFFEGEDIKTLNCIETDNEECILYGHKIFEMKEADIVKLLKDNGNEDIETEDEEWGERRVSFYDILIDFYFEEEQLISVSWGVFDEEEE